MLRRQRSLNLCTLHRPSCEHLPDHVRTCVHTCVMCIILGVVLSYRRMVIAVGLEEEDRMDQWIQDAESVS